MLPCANRMQALQSLAFILIVAVYWTDAKRFPGKDEFETIDISRQIVKRIEDCAVDAREAVSESEDELPNIASKDDVVCGEHTFMHITKVMRNKLSNTAVQRKALATSFKAIQQHNSFIDIADYIEKQVIQTAGGNWLCIVGKRGLFDSNHEAKLSEYLMFSISHIQVQLLKLPDASSSASSASPIVCPPPATAPTSCQVQLNSAAKGKVKRSSMSAEQRADTLNYIKTALNEYAGSAEGVQYVCPYVTNELAIAHGSYQWACVAGLSSAYQFTHTVARPVQLQVQFDALHVQVLQLPTASGGNTLPSYPTPPPQPPLVCPPVSTVPNRPTTAVRTLLTQYDVLAAAREQLNPKYVHINETRMAGQMQARALNIVFDAVATEGTYESVARKMRDLAAQAFGNYWTATVGTDTQYWSYFHLTEPYFINLKIDRLRVLLYRQIMYRVG